MSAPIDFANLIAKSRAVPIEQNRAARHRAARRVDRCGPCPVCGGVDRLSINVKKQLWNCRGCGLGGDVIALVQHLDGTGLVTAVETLAGQRASSLAAPMVAPAGSAAAKDYEREHHRKARWLWRQRQPLAGSIAGFARRLRRNGSMTRADFTRWRLPDRRKSETFALQADGVGFTVTAEPF